jgi:hypothetical protein
MWQPIPNWLMNIESTTLLSRREVAHFPDRERILVIVMGILLALFSFVNIPIGFGNPPYSIGDADILDTRAKGKKRSQAIQQDITPPMPSAPTEVDTHGSP